MRDVLKNACGLPVDTKVMQINFRGAYVHLFPLAASSGHPRRRVTTAMIRACMTPDIPVITWTPPAENFVDWPKAVADTYTRGWFAERLAPLLSGLPKDCDQYVGGDFGRSGDLSVFIPATEQRDLRLVPSFTPYILKADISKYFPSIDQAVLMRRVERVIADKSVLWLFDTLIRNGNPGYGVGIPIGALTSQWLANLYLDSLDHYIKDDLGIQYYLRYMDDFVVIGPSKLWCRTVLEQVEKYLTCTLHLRLNPKTGIWPVTHGLDFVG